MVGRNPVLRELQIIWLGWTKISYVCHVRCDLSVVALPMCPGKREFQSVDYSLLLRSVFGNDLGRAENYPVRLRLSCYPADHSSTLSSHRQRAALGDSGSLLCLD